MAYLVADRETEGVLDIKPKQQPQKLSILLLESCLKVEPLDAGFHDYPGEAGPSPKRRPPSHQPQRHPSICR